MIVADVNLVTYLLVPGPHTAAARSVQFRDSDWIAPGVWLYEFVNVMASHVRTKQFDTDHAMKLIADAKSRIQSIDTQAS